MVAPPPRELFSDAVIEALDHSGIGVTLTRYGRSGIEVLYASPRAALIIGRSQEELLSTDVFDLLAGDQHPSMATQTEAWGLGSATPQRLSTAVVRPGGERVEIEIGFARIQFQGAPATVTFIVDVTEHHRAQVALKRSEQRFRRLVEASPQAMAIVCGRLVLFANEAMSRIPGLHVGSPWPDPSPELAAALSNPPPAPIYLTLWTQLEGVSRRFELTLFAVDFDVGPATIVIAQDETEKGQMQSQLVSADRLASLGSLASGIAHGVNNPLTTVLLNLSSVRRDLAQLGSSGTEIDRSLHKLDQALEAAERVRRSIRQLRGFSSWRQSPADLDIRNVLDAVIDLVGFATSPAVTLVNDYQPVPLVHAEEAGLAHVFLALVRNALQAIPDDDSEGQVLIETFAEGEWVVVQVSDTGVGISGDVSQIFEPFFTTDSRHSGLGLSICHNIVQAHGGRISVPSRENPTIIRVELRASQPEREDGRQRPRILVVEPDVRSASNVRQTLKEDAHVIRVIGSSQRGLEVALSAPLFDLMIADSQLSRPTVTELRDALAQHRPELAGRLVAATATGSPDLPPDLGSTVHGPITADVVDRLLRSLDGHSSSG